MVFTTTGIPLTSSAIGAAMVIGAIFLSTIATMPGRKGEVKVSSADSRCRRFSRDAGLIVAPGNIAVGEEGAS